METFLDLDNWPRTEHFHFFRKFEEPFFGATVQIDCSSAYVNAKEANSSFFAYYLHKTLIAINAIECFRYRIKGDEIVIHPKIDASATIGRADGTFGFSLIKYNSDFPTFEKITNKEIERIQNTTGLFTREFESDNVIHFSAIPWLNFTSLSHARIYNLPDSCPKVSFGKMVTDEYGKRSMPMSVHVHHGLMDGLHLGQFFELFQQLMNK